VVKPTDELIDALDACADHLEKLNAKFPKLACDVTHEGVENWRKRQVHFSINYEEKDHGAPIELGAGDVIETEAETEDLGELARELLEANNVDDVVDVLTQDYDPDMSVSKLIELVGNGSYVAALKREVSFLEENAVTFEQIAELWNQLDRPALGGDKWTARSVSILAE
jgi:hypothetical protein